MIKNILPVTRNSPRIELHHITDEISQQNQQSQDRNIDISATSFLCEQKNDPDIIKMIDSITSETPYPKFKNHFNHPDTGLFRMKRKYSQPENSPHIKIIVPHVLKYKILEYLPYMPMHPYSIYTPN